MRNIPSILAIVLLFSGCVNPVTSLHPLHEGAPIADVPQLIGSWKGDDANWTFTEAPGDGYRCVITDAEGRSGSFIVHPIHLNNVLYLSLTPEVRDEEKLDFYAIHILPVHGMMRVDALDPNLRLSTLKADWFESPEATRAISSVEYEDGLLLTAAPETLREVFSSPMAADAWSEIGAWTKQ